MSEAVWDAYMTYGNVEFGTKHCEIRKDNTNRHVKLINFTDKEVINHISSIHSNCPKFSYMYRASGHKKFGWYWRVAVTGGTPKLKIVYLLRTKRCARFREIKIARSD